MMQTQTVTPVSYTSWAVPRYGGYSRRGGKRAKVFTAEKDALVRREYALYRDRRELAVLAERLQVSLRALYSRAYRLGLSRTTDRW